MMGRSVLAALATVATAAACGHFFQGPADPAPWKCVPVEHPCPGGGCCLHSERCGGPTEDYPQGTCVGIDTRVGARPRNRDGGS